ncbi:Uncharacterised protein [Zhongshania aliphaticivorans]|nr:Uncharacterised protein [Zhongshania aliphaticivorans]
MLKTKAGPPCSKLHILPPLLDKFIDGIFAHPLIGSQPVSLPIYHLYPLTIKHYCRIMSVTRDTVSQLLSASGKWANITHIQ